ncbi:MAG: hypothetical protein AAF961_19415, partial [Planctomycetota bacterium]
LSVRYGSVAIRCRPLLSFDRVSRDGFWSIFARGEKGVFERTFVGGGLAGGVFRGVYSDQSTILLQDDVSSGTTELTASSLLPRTTYSHLNSFCTFDVSGYERLSLRFSPCPDQAIEPLPADYPVGRPARFAYVDDSGRFSIVEASSGEKGPFRSLAAGRLERGEPLSITVCDNDRPIVTIRLDDWSRQLSTQLSPTAGWDVPVNAIEFQRLDDRRRSPTSIWITLAATSVGRGWDCVGHQSGQYRNRITLRDASP